MVATLRSAVGDPFGFGEAFSGADGRGFEADDQVLRAERLSRNGRVAWLGRHVREARSRQSPRNCTHTA